MTKEINLVRCRSHLVFTRPMEWESIATFSDARSAIRELRETSHVCRASGDVYALTIDGVPQEIVDDLTLCDQYTP